MPDDEEGQILAQEITTAKRELHALLVAEAYERVPIKLLGSRVTKTLLDWTQRHTNVRERIAGGQTLQDNIEAAKLRVQLLEELNESYNQRVEEQFEVGPAPDPEIPGTDFVNEGGPPKHYSGKAPEGTKITLTDPLHAVIPTEAEAASLD